MQKKEFSENSHLKYINGKIYFEDKYDEDIIKMSKTKSNSAHQLIRKKDGQ